MKSLGLVGLFFAIALTCTGWAGEKVFDPLQFQKSYASRKVDERMAAVAMLNGMRHPAVFVALTRVASIDAEPDVRLKAFTLMAEWPDPDGRLAETLVPIFREEKDIETRIAMSEFLPRLPVKTLALDALIDLVKMKRRPYPRALAVLNQMTGQSFDRDRDTFIEVQKWWELHREDYQKADALTLQKLQGRSAPEVTTVIAPLQ